MEANGGRQPTGELREPRAEAEIADDQGADATRSPDSSNRMLEVRGNGTFNAHVIGTLDAHLYRLSTQQRLQPVETLFEFEHVGGEAHADVALGAKG